ncbi:MAG: mechanosensitive ion channel family protein [Chloroflexi bacterium]|nr:mechanosensitive ion channel family protein [Chloroflexota bacterium]
MTWDSFGDAVGRLAEASAFRVSVAVLVALCAWRTAEWARRSFEGATRATHADANTRLIAGRLVYGCVLALGMIWVLSLVGLEPAAILATFGAVGLALSLAVQDILKSFFAGLYLLFERPFLIGDEIDVRGQIGAVEHVGFRATNIRTADNVLIVVPNTIIFAEVVANRSQVRRDPPAPNASN